MKIDVFKMFLLLRETDKNENDSQFSQSIPDLSHNQSDEKWILAEAE